VVAHETVAPETGFPDASVSFTTSGSKLAKLPNAHVGHVSWPLPEKGERFAGVPEICAKSGPAAIAMNNRNLNLGMSTS
jgi:hypothetical protein